MIAWIMSKLMQIGTVVVVISVILWVSKHPETAADAVSSALGAAGDAVGGLLTAGARLLSKLH